MHIIIHTQWLVFKVTYNVWLQVAASSYLCGVGVTNKMKLGWVLMAVVREAFRSSPSTGPYRPEHSDTDGSPSP